MIRLFKAPLIAIFLGLSCSAAFGQITLGEVYSPDYGNGDRIADHLVVEFIHTSFLDAPRGINSKIPSTGFNVYWTKDFAFGDSPFSFATGFGLGSDHIHNNAQYNIQTDSITGETFTEVLPYEGGYSYKRNKLVLNYFEVPLELRFKTKSKWRVYVGVKGGILANPHTKRKDDSGRYKDFNIPHFLPYRYGAMVHVGRKKINFNGFYSLTPLFEDGKGTSVTLWSAGISLYLF